MWMWTNLGYTQKLACICKSGGVTIRCKFSLPVFPQSHCTHYIPTKQKALSPWCKLFPKKIPLRIRKQKTHQLQKALIVHEWRRGIIDTCMKCSNLVLETTTNNSLLDLISEWWRPCLAAAHKVITDSGHFALFSWRER